MRKVLRDNLDDLRAKHRELSDKRLKLVQEHGKLQGSWQWADTEIEILRERILRIKKDIADFEMQIAEFSAAEKQSAQEHADNKKNAELAAEKSAVLTGELESLETELAAQAAETNSEVTRLKARLDTLQSITENEVESEDGNFALAKKAAENLLRLGSQIDLSDIKYAPLVEFCLVWGITAFSFNHPAVSSQAARRPSIEILIRRYAGD